MKEFALNKEERKEETKEKETKWNNKCFFTYYQGNGLNIIGYWERSLNSLIYVHFKHMGSC